MAKKKERIEEPVLAEGILLSHGFYEREENRVLTLLLKGVIVYLYTMGGIGFYLSALGVTYNKVLVHAVIFVMAILCALLYYRLLTENVGYLVFLLGFAGLVYVFRDYINSGFYALVNITVDLAAQYFDIDMQKLYNERIGDRYTTITMVALFIGIVLDILLNVYISRRMQYMNALITILPVNLIPIYMTLEPNMIYALMIVAATAIAMVYKTSRHYSPLMQVKRKNTVFERKKRKKRVELSYVYDVKALLQAGIIAFCFAMIVVFSVTVIKPVENFNVGYKTNKYKEVTMAAVGTFLVDGIEGFFRTSMRGGVRARDLGSLSRITMDHQTDIVLEFTPYDTNMVYLKGYVGLDYIPYQNRWVTDESAYDISVHPEADGLSEAFDENAENTSRGVMRVNNVDGERGVHYLPYYYQTVESPSKSDKIVYYPRLAANETKIPAEYYPDGKPYTDRDLFVPEENKAAMKRLSDSLQLSGKSRDEIVQAVAEYFSDEIPYTVKPGKTPRDADFVNYFLEENKKGYCVHFASAAVLIFRYMGIPARFIEGYAVDIEEVYNGTLLDDKKYSDYYEGYSALGETGLVRVNVPDDDAHAWVEIYDEDLGWKVVDVTPSASSEEDTSSFWDEFDEIMGDGDEDNTQDGTGVGGGVPATVMRGIVYTFFGILGAVILAVLGFLTGKRIAYLIRFSKAGYADKLIMRYAQLVKRRARRDKPFRECLNYRTQITYLARNLSEDAAQYEWLIDTLELAGFSKNGIDEQNYLTAKTACETLYKRRNPG